MAKHIKKPKTKQKELDWAAIIAGLWVICMFVVQPLIMNNGYRDILNFKYGFYLLTTAVMLALIVGYELISGEKFKNWFSKLNLMDYCFALFAGVLVISTLQAYPYIYAAFFGNEGRYCGFIFWFMACLAYFAISRTFVFKKGYIIGFVAASLIVGLWTIGNYFYLDPFGFKHGFDEVNFERFFSTMGNVNTLTGYLALPLGVSGLMFIKNRGKMVEEALYLIAFVVTVCAMVVARSDNAYIAFGVFFVLAPFFAWKTRKEFRRSLVILASFFSAFGLVKYWNENAHCFSVDHSFFRFFDKIPYVGLIIAMLWMIAAAFYVYDIIKKVSDETPMPKTLTRIWLGIIIAGVSILIYLLIRANSEEHYVPAALESLRGTLVFGDEWGTYRGYIWRATLENYAEFPFHHKLFGTGPETTSIYMWNWKFDEMIAATSLKFDSPHNAWIQMFVTTGPFGLIGYLGTFITTMIMAIKNRLKEIYPYMLALAFAGICHLTQSFVNIMTPIDYPTVFAVLIVAGAMFRRCDET